MEMGQLVTTFVLLDTLHDDAEEGHSKIEKLLVPLALCGCMGSGSNPPVAATSPTGAATTQPTYVTDNSSQIMQVLLLSAFMRRRPYYSKGATERDRD